MAEPVDRGVAQAVSFDAVPGQLTRLAVSADAVPAGALTWGQRAMVRTVLAMGEDAAYFTMTRVIHLAEPSPADVVRAAIAGLVADHHSLRTVLQRDRSDIRQCVWPEVAVQVYTVQATTGPAAIARDLKRQPFDLWHEIPIRMALVLRGDLVDSVVLAVSHLAVDAAAMDVLESDLSSRIAGLASAPRAGLWQPTDQAEFEATPTALAASSRAVQRWRQIIEGGLPAEEPRPTPGDADRFQEWCLDSQEAALAASTVADRAQVSPASVVLAAWCLVLGLIDDSANNEVITLISGNRRRDREQRYVGPLAQDTLFSVRWDDGCGIDEFAVSVHRQALSAYANGRYDPVLLYDTLGTRGPKVRTFFNYARRVLPADQAAAEVMPAARPVLRGQWPYLDLFRFLVMQEHGRSLRLRLLADTSAPTQPHPPDTLAAVRDVVIRAAGGAAVGELKAVLR